SGGRRRCRGRRETARGQRGDRATGAVMTALDAIARSLAEGWWMFFDTFWALVVGFGLSGAVQAFVSRTEMQRALGDHRPVTLTKSTFFGMVSSSCSYAASALAKTLFEIGRAS